MTAPWHAPLSMIPSVPEVAAAFLAAGWAVDVRGHTMTAGTDGLRIEYRMSGHLSTVSVPADAGTHEHVARPSRDWRLLGWRRGGGARAVVDAATSVLHAPGMSTSH